MTTTGAPAGWYPDPAGTGGQRYFDGTAWTEHFVPPPPPTMPGYGYPIGKPPWKGATFGRPAFGPGALASPGRRLGARALDGLVLLPVTVVLCAVALSIAAPHFGPIFPKVSNNPNASLPFPGFFWIYVTIFACILATGIFMIFYEAIFTVRYGRTLGKSWLHIRPIRTDGKPLGWGSAFGRIIIYFLSGFLSWLGLLDPLWCLWDENQQCLHDKAAGTLVINDELDEVNQADSATAATTSNWQPGQQDSTTLPAGNNPYANAYWAGMPTQPRKNGLVIASLICSIGGMFLFGVPSIVGLILGFVARSRIRNSNGQQTGGGLALAGIIVGLAVVPFWLLIVIIPAATN